MTFFEGSSNNSQWVSLVINILTIIIYGIAYQQEPKFRTRSAISIFLAIFIISLYYIAIDKTSKEGNVFYFGASIMILINPIYLPPK
jgi:hypothetical protein